jgi:transcriptional regulator with XRE-family HTH domain
MVATESGVRERRLASGLTQAELATRAGVSRQLVAAVEASRHAPAVDAALGIARALGTTVEILFAPQRGKAIAALGGEPREGALLRLGRVDDVLVTTELADHGIAGTVWAKPDAVVEGGNVRLLPGAVPGGFVLAGCDPALGVAEALLAGLGPLSLLAISASTGAALDAMKAGRVHAAVVHGPVDRLPTPPVTVARWNLAKWHVGLAIAGRLRTHTLEAALRGNKPIVQQDSRAASQQALERAGRVSGIEVLPIGPRASSPVDAARLAHAMGVTGVTIEACALAFEMDFVPIEEHLVEIWVDERWLGHPGLAALGDILTSAAFTDRVSLFGGYDLGRCGQRVEAA